MEGTSTQFDPTHGDKAILAYAQPMAPVIRKGRFLGATAVILSTLIVLIVLFLVRSAVDAFGHASNVTNPGWERLVGLIENPYSFNRPAFPSRKLLAFTVTSGLATVAASAALLFCGLLLIFHRGGGMAWIGKAIVAVILGIVMTIVSLALLSRNLAQVHEHWMLLGDYLSRNRILFGYAPAILLTPMLAPLAWLLRRWRVALKG